MPSGSVSLTIGTAILGPVGNAAVKGVVFGCAACAGIVSCLAVHRKVAETLAFEASLGVWEFLPNPDSFSLYR